jgi:Chromo (CHRromatin Organisation MOdifier) domain
MDQPPKYKKDDLVYRRLEIPVDKFGNRLHNTKFRQGENRYEMIPRKVVQVLTYSSHNPWRYILDTLPNVSYAEAELLPAQNETEEKFIVRKIIGKKTEKKIMYYLVWWKKSLKKNATWEPKTKLVEDGLVEYIKQYEDDIKVKRKKKRLKLKQINK